MPTPTTILQAQTHQWLGAFCGPGNGDSRQELMRAAQVLTAYAAGILFPTEGEIRRLDGLSGNAAPLRERLAWKLGWITHGKDDHLLDLPQVQTRLKAPPDAIVTHPESGLTGSLFDCPDIPLAPGGACLRLIVATHPTTRHSRSRWDHP